MKKIGILTLTDNNNYGNRLQNYAVQKVLNNLGFQTESIINRTIDRKNRNLKYYLSILSFNKIKEKLKSIYMMRVVYKVNKNIVTERKKNFEDFNKNIIFNKTEINKNKNLEYLQKEYDFFVVGSDQVWNPFSPLIKEINFLEFSPKEKNIAYSASFGVSEIPMEQINTYKKGLENFKKISVREEKGKQIVEELSESKAEVLIDPTMMLSKDEWLKVSKEVEWLPEKYIVTFFLGNISKKRKAFLEKIKKEKNIEIINLNQIKDKKSYSIGPSEFIYIISKAAMIFTDSFHGSVFSIIFDKPFYVMNRDTATKSMNSRIETLLKKFDLEDRKMNTYSQNINIECNYTGKQEKIIEEQEKAKKFLKEALNI